MREKSEPPNIRLLREEDVSRRHQLYLSHLSPWDRSNSDPTLSPQNEKLPHLVTGTRYSRRPLIPQCQFRSSFLPQGELEFKPEYREVYIAHPSDACASPRLSRRRKRYSTVEGISLGAQDNKPYSSADIQHHSNYQHQDDDIESTLVSNNNFETENRSQFDTPHSTLEDRVKLIRQDTTLHLEGDYIINPTEYKQCYSPSHGILTPRNQPVKPRLNLYTEGDFIFETEVNTNFRPYSVLALKRPELIRYNTQLHLEGNMNINPEYRAEFVDFPRQRPVVTKSRDNLHLEKGISMETLSEQKDKYSGGPLSPRAEIVRRPNTLRLSGGDQESRPRPATAHGETSPSAEYRDAYKDFPRQRPETLKPAGSLTPEGPWLGKSPEYSSAYIDFPRQRPETKKQTSSLKPFGGVNENSHEYKESYKDFPRKRPTVKKPKENLKQEGKLNSNPEYREQYKNFPRNRPDVKKPQVNLKTEGEFTDQNAEYRENYKDSPRHRPIVKKPPTTLKPSGEMMEKYAEYTDSYKKFPCKRPDIKKPVTNLKPSTDPMDKSAEYTESYQNFPRERPRTKKPTHNLKPEGEWVDSHEYRDSYVDFPRQRPEVPRPEGNLKSEGPWLGRFPEYRAAFIDLPRHRPIVPKPCNKLDEADALGGGYEPLFNGVARPGTRPKTAGSPRSQSPAGVITGAPKHTKRSFSPHDDNRSPSRGRYLGRPGHLSEARPPSRCNHAMVVTQPSLDSNSAFQLMELSPSPVLESRQVTFDVPMSPRSRTVSRECAAAKSSFKVIEPVKGVKGRPKEERTRNGNGWLQSDPIKYKN